MLKPITVLNTKVYFEIQAVRTKKMVDHLAVSKPEWRKELVEAKQIANQNVAQYPVLDDEDEDEPSLPPIEYKPPTPSPSPPPKPPSPAMRPPKRRSPPKDKISFSSVGSLFTGNKSDKSFCKNMQEEESDSE